MVHVLMVSARLVATVPMGSLDRNALQVSYAFLCIMTILFDVQHFSGTYYKYLLDANDCAGSPCNNGGVCIDGIATYTCKCPEGFNGSDCETSISNH